MWDPRGSQSVGAAAAFNRSHSPFEYQYGALIGEVDARDACLRLRNHMQEDGRRWKVANIGR